MIIGFQNLEKIQQKYIQLIGEIHGQGLFIGIDFINIRLDEFNKIYLVQNIDLAIFVCQTLKEKFHILTGLNATKNTLRIKPPMVITLNDIDYFNFSFEKCLELYSK